MDKINLDVIVENSQEAKKQWEEFQEQCKDVDEFKKKFHLRPTKRGITIVSTLQEKPMRGKKVGRTVVKKWINELYDLTMSNKSQVEKLQVLTQLGFQEKTEGSSVKKEESYQAEMIAKMSCNQTLKDFLEVDELIFIASEFIIHDKSDTSNRERIDIIGYDRRDKLIFFELKMPDSNDKPIEQLKKYIDKYGGEKLEEMLKILKEYPINSVDSKDIVIEGCAVYGYGEKVNVNVSKKEIEEYKGSIIREIRFLEL